MKESQLKTTPLIECNMHYLRIIKAIRVGFYLDKDTREFRKMLGGRRQVASNHADVNM